MSHKRHFSIIYKSCSFHVLSIEDTQELAEMLLGEKLWRHFLESLQIETSYSISGLARFRVSVFRQRGSVSIILRPIPFTVPTLESLQVPKVVKTVSGYTRGLILLTGITGSGKSSTLAAMIQFINENYQYHIITIEDPIEFLHSDLKSSISQREIGVDTEDFSSAFKAALRQDPDVIMVGELRDSQTMEIALRAAETGHLVLSTLHTTDAKETIGRIIDSFPPHQQNQIRLQLAANLRAVISQRLLNRSDKEGLVLAAEVMIVTAAIREMICHPEKAGDMLAHIEKGEDQYGTCSFDQSIMSLYERCLISKDEAIKNATNANDFKLKLSLK